MRKLPLLVALIISTALASSALAAGYGAAGCGFGGMVIKDNKILPQIGAWFLNSLLGNQTFAITSGTSECKGLGTVMAEKEQSLFVENNYHSLANEMAAGEGETLTTLSGLMGCTTEASGTFAAYTKEHYTSLFKTEETTPNEMLAALKTGMSQDPVLAGACPRT